MSLALAAIALGSRIGPVYRDLAGNRLELLVLPLVTLAVMTAAAAVGLQRSSVLAQVLSRGVALIVFLSASYPIARGLADGQMVWSTALWFMSFGSGAALALSRPGLHTAAAQRAFAPVAFRSFFLVGAVSAVTAATTTGLHALSYVAGGDPAGAVGLAALAVGFLAAACGVVRMRAWGVVLGVLTAVAACVRGGSMTALVLDGGGDALIFAFTAMPAVAFGLPVILSRLRRATRGAAHGSAGAPA